MVLFSFYVPTRSLGTSELLVEASFADLRHGGSGDLNIAHDLAKKVIIRELICGFELIISCTHSLCTFIT